MQTWDARPHENGFIGGRFSLSARSVDQPKPLFGSVMFAGPAYRLRLCGFLGPKRFLVLARMRRRSERSRTTAIKVIAVMASGAEKLKTRIASWSRAALMAQTITAAAAQNNPRESISHPFVRFSSHVRFQAKNRALRDRYGNVAAQIRGP